MSGMQLFTSISLVSKKPLIVFIGKVYGRSWKYYYSCTTVLELGTMAGDQICLVFGMSGFLFLMAIDWVMCRVTESGQREIQCMGFDWETQGSHNSTCKGRQTIWNCMEREWGWNRTLERPRYLPRTIIAPETDIEMVERVTYLGSVMDEQGSEGQRETLCQD